MVQFLVDLCRPSQLSVGPILRGFYFTGVRPIIINEAAPVAAAAPQQQAGYGTAAGATGIFKAGPQAQAPQAPPPQVGGTRKVPQWLFLGHWFTDVLLSDRAAMGASGASTRTSFARRVLFLAAAVLCLALSIVFTISFFNNHGLETRLRTAARGQHGGAQRPATIWRRSTACANWRRSASRSRRCAGTSTMALPCFTAWAFMSGTISIPRRGAFISTASASCCSHKLRTPFCKG